jgi:hypothetical protein
MLEAKAADGAFTAPLIPAMPALKKPETESPVLPIPEALSPAAPKNSSVDSFCFRPQR